MKFRPIFLGAIALTLSASCSDERDAERRVRGGKQVAEVAAPAVIPRGAELEDGGRLTIVEAPLPAPFATLSGDWPKAEPPAARRPRLAHPSVPAELRRFIRAFPQAERPNGAVLDLASQHVVVLRDGCFFLDRDGASDPLVHFPLHVGLTVDREGFLAFRSRYDGQQDNVRVGTPAETGWFTEPFPAPAEVAAQCGAGAMVGVTTVSNPYASPDRFLGVLRRFRDRERLTEGQALARANACAIRQVEIAADRRLRGSTEEPPSCRMFWGY